MIAFSPRRRSTSVEKTCLARMIEADFFNYLLNPNSMDERSFVSPSMQVPSCFQFPPSTWPIANHVSLLFLLLAPNDNRSWAPVKIWHFLSWETTMITDKQVEYVIIPIVHEYLVIVLPNLTILCLMTILIVFYQRQGENLRRALDQVDSHGSRSFDLSSRLASTRRSSSHSCL